MYSISLNKILTYFISVSVLFSIISCEKTVTKNIVLQPFSDFPTLKAKLVMDSIKKNYPNCTLKKNIPFPPNSYNKDRNRYRADSILKYLKTLGNNESVFVGLSTKDISTTKGDIKDWGVMGLGYRPGNACVVSTYRLSNKNKMEQFYKLVFHELGHTQGLPHCNVKSCFMRDAEGGNPLDEEVAFCGSCKKFLIRKGWVMK